MTTTLTRSRWRPLGLGRTMAEKKIVGIPAKYVWGAAGFTGSLVGGALTSAVLPADYPMSPMLVGSFLTALGGAALLIMVFEKPKAAVPWAVGAAIPGAVQLVYGALFPRAAAAA